jgi:hypothetical protein
MGSRPSWWLKLDRADHHLEEVDRYLTDYEGKDVYRARRVPDAHGDESIWRYVLEITEGPDERLPLAIGDAIHNMRTALDHILAAMRSRKHRYAEGFPILTEDPWEGQLTKAKAYSRARFSKAVVGLDAKAVAAIKLLQPYLDKVEGRNPDHNALRVISRLDNADKHREPIIAVPGIMNAETMVTARAEQITQAQPPPRMGYPAFIEDGAEVAHFRWLKSPALTEAEVKVGVRGTALVALDVGIKDGYMAARVTLATSLGYLYDHVIPVLEQFLPER